MLDIIEYYSLRACGERVQAIQCRRRKEWDTERNTWYEKRHFVSLRDRIYEKDIEVEHA